MSWLDTPRGLAGITGALVVLFAGVGFWIGYDIARNAAAPTQIIFQPGAIQVQPAPATGKP